jgi:hypothetical protein
MAITVDERAKLLGGRAEGGDPGRPAIVVERKM